MKYTLAFTAHFMMGLLYCADQGLSDLVKMDDGMPHAGIVQLDAARSIPFTFESTSKGNGVLRIANLSLRVMDVHDDGAVFDGRFLEVKIIDLDDKIGRGLMLVGTLLLTGEKETTINRPQPICCLYRWDDSRAGFTVLYERNGKYIRLDEVR